jgi:DNA/RNA endonuclease G, NUC1
LIPFGTGDIFTFPSLARHYNISQITCRRPLRATVRNYGRCHNSEYKHFGIGVTVRQSQSTKEFIKLVDICFDPQHRASVYAKFTLMQGTASIQRSVRRRKITCTPYFEYETGKYDELYSRESQYRTLLELLGSVDQTVKFISRNTSSDLFLTKGQLVAGKDFVYNSQKQVTLFCINTAPMWQVMRKGNWRSLENSIHQYASRKGKDLTVYTGTYGVLNLPHVNGSNVQIYLDIDRNGHNFLPVPELFWKLLYDRLTRQGIVFLGINNHQKGLYPKQYELCPDVSNRTQSWFTGWDRHQISLGHVYSCNVRDFLARTNVIPKFRENVIGLLT